MSRIACGFRGERSTTTSRPMRESATRSLDVADGTLLHEDRVLDLATDELAARADRGERADVGVDKAGTSADDRRAADGAAGQAGARLDHHLADDGGLGVDGAFDAALEREQDEAVRLEQVVFFAGVDPVVLELHRADVDARRRPVPGSRR